MIVILAALGVRPALLVGFAIPTSFFALFCILSTDGGNDFKHCYVWAYPRGGDVGGRRDRSCRIRR